jgi:hypothetical protein
MNKKSGYVVPSVPSAYRDLLPSSNVQIDMCQDIVAGIEAIHSVSQIKVLHIFLNLLICSINSVNFYASTFRPCLWRNDCLACECFKFNIIL